jgi:hypothetical protein
LRFLENSQPGTKKLFTLQVLIALIANLGPVNTGMVFGFSAVAIPQLMSANSTITIDKDQASWIGNYIYFLFAEIHNIIDCDLLQQVSLP